MNRGSAFSPYYNEKTNVPSMEERSMKIVFAKSAHLIMHKEQIDRLARQAVMLFLFRTEKLADFKVHEPLSPITSSFTVKGTVDQLY